jgi:hypothetical protein
MALLGSASHGFGVLSPAFPLSRGIATPTLASETISAGSASAGEEGLHHGVGSEKRDRLPKFSEVQFFSFAESDKFRQRTLPLAGRERGVCGGGVFSYIGVDF